MKRFLVVSVEDLDGACGGWFDDYDAAVRETEKSANFFEKDYVMLEVIGKTLTRREIYLRDKHLEPIIGGK